MDPKQEKAIREWMYRVTYYLHREEITDTDEDLYLKHKLHEAFNHGEDKQRLRDRDDE